MLIINNLWVETEGKKILQGLSLTIKPGEIHAVMGPNGAGKSTLAKVIAGHPQYTILRGQITCLGQDILDKDPAERSLLGLFLGFQYPVEIPGVTNFQFLHAAHRAHAQARVTDSLNEEAFREKMLAAMEGIGIPPSFIDREVNGGFSGGEKKRNEILQMQLLDPHFVCLDETDSGLDIDALKVVAEGVRTFANEHKGLLIITHYQRLLDHLDPDFVHVLNGGKIVESGNASLALHLEAKGYG
ncbi:MAG: Fe-S cluster assembly ATPase SufC [Chlamydiota bacterium]|nr:Fe-S cluster assembly ATPase SufC [Chlamydiota bacterium]